MRVLAFDNDETVALRSDCAIFRRVGEVAEVSTAQTTADASRLLAARSYDAILMFVSSADAGSLAALATFRAAAPSAAIVLVAASVDESEVLCALRAGAQDCLLRDDVAIDGLPRLLQCAVERQRRLAALEAARIDAAHRATHDALTGLANRDLFLDQLDRALALGARYGRKTGVLFVDLDGFKDINDAYGHTLGDTLLRVVSARLLECVRRSDAVARLGGDEFVVLLPDVTSRRDVARVRDTILSCLRAPIEVDTTRSLRVDASVGGAMSPLDGVTVQALIDAADADMYRDKSQRRRSRSPLVTSAVGTGTMRSDDWPLAVARRDADGPDGLGRERRVRDSRLRESRLREGRMRDAVSRGEFEVHFQPIVDVLTNRVVCAESLLRWRDPVRGLLLPSDFLSLAEEAGLIVPIGEWVLREACRAVVDWRARLHHTSIRVSVNVSAVQFRERNFAARLARILTDTGCPPSALTLELTANTMVVDADVASRAMRELKSMGVRLLLDDFGIGFGSLAFVREAPVDGIKLDRQFVQSMLTDLRDHAIVASTIRLAQGLSIDVIAEGVESAAHARLLASLQCFAQQGAHYSPAVCRSEFEQLLTDAPGLWGLIGLPSEALVRAPNTNAPPRRSAERPVFR